jgi:hypothetical protein
VAGAADATCCSTVDAIGAGLGLWVVAVLGRGVVADVVVVDGTEAVVAGDGAATGAADEGAGGGCTSAGRNESGST